MQREGPVLETLLRRLIETPGDYLAEPRIGKEGEVNVAAVVWDLLRDLGHEPLPAKQVDRWLPAGRGAKQRRNELQLVLITCWLLGDQWFAGHPELARSARSFLEDVLPELAPHLRADRLLRDPDRREEWTRRVLGALALRPAGETREQAADRLQTLDSVERERVLRESAAAEKRAQEIREAMARKAAQESASRYGE